MGCFQGAFGFVGRRAAPPMGVARTINSDWGNQPMLLRFGMVLRVVCRQAGNGTFPWPSAKAVAQVPGAAGKMGSFRSARSAARVAGVRVWQYADGSFVVSCSIVCSSLSIADGRRAFKRVGGAICARWGFCG